MDEVETLGFSRSGEAVHSWFFLLPTVAYQRTPLCPGNAGGQMFKAKVKSPEGQEYFITAPTEWELHRKVQGIVGKINVSKFTSTTLRGGHTRILGGGWEIVLYCSGR